MERKNKNEELHVETLEEQVKELREKIAHLLELCIPPAEVRNEIKRNLITAQVSLLKIFKTLLDYQISTLERLAGEEEKSKKQEKRVKKIKLE